MSSPIRILVQWGSSWGLNKWRKFSLTGRTPVLMPMNLELGARGPRTPKDRDVAEARPGRARRRFCLGRLVAPEDPATHICQPFVSLNDLMDPGGLDPGKLPVRFTVWYRRLKVPGRPSNAKPAGLWVLPNVLAAIQAYLGQINPYAGLTLGEYLARVVAS